MVRRVPTAEEWGKKYRQRVATSGSEWVEKTLAATGIAEAGKSNEAEEAYSAKMAVVIAEKRRQKGLSNVTDEDIKRPIRAGGSALWTTATSAKAEKAQQGVAPVLADIAAALPNLPKRSADPVANVARVTAMVQALVEGKKRRG